MTLEPGLSEWLRTWGETRGRPLRILHIGNIANNAYINAKIQRQCGVDADVVCYDYYHVMGAPEWEDSDFSGDVGDDAFPDWSRVDLRGFKRPMWFVQGRLGTCRQYLLAVREGRLNDAARLWRRLRAERWLACRGTRTAGVARHLVRGARASARRLRGGSRRAWKLGQAAVRRTPRTVGAHQTAAVGLPTPSFHGANEVARLYGHHFPDRAPFRVDTYLEYLSDTENWRSLLQQYDIVQAYALDPAIPFAAGVPYVAYEHGTIREIPFEETPRGHLCALSYRAAAGVFVTNSDNLVAARRLGIPADRIVPLPHAVDSARLARFREQNADLAPPGGRLRIFSPARHDWVDGDLSWTKGNDRLLNGFRRFLDGGSDAELVLVRWGRDLDASLRLIRELDLETNVLWIDTMRKEALWREYMQSNAIADQFVLPAFGGVTFEALALGRRVITSLDVDLAREFFGELPPLLVASTPEECEHALWRVATDPSDREGLGARAADWFDERHSSRRIVELQLETYRRMLERPIERAASS